MNRISEAIGRVMQGARDAVSEPKAPQLRSVEQVRQRITRGQASELVRLRSFLSSIDGNQYAVDQLRGEVGDLLLADITELVLTHLGHTTEVTRMADGKDGVASQARKAARGSL